MKYLLLGDETKTLFVEDDEQLFAVYYDSRSDQWFDGTYKLWKNRVGFDPSEPTDSPYRYGNLSCMEDIVDVSKEEAEAFIGSKIDENMLTELLNQF